MQDAQFAKDIVDPKPGLNLVGSGLPLCLLEKYVQRLRRQVVHNWHDADRWSTERRLSTCNKLLDGRNIVAKIVGSG